jgi:hypothetical protein
MKQFYEASKTNGTIRPVCVSHETDKFVYVRSRVFREAKIATYTSYFESYEQAKEWLVSEAADRLKKAVIEKELAEARLKEVSQL